MTRPADSTDPFDAFVEMWVALRRSLEEEPAIFVVEGERDRRSLLALGVDAPIVLVHAGRSLSQTAHDLAVRHRRIIVLTDWDTEGGHLAHRLAELLTPGSARVDLAVRRDLARIIHGEVVHVEGLAGWARRNADRRGAALDHFLDGR
jgi:5S rRNA maturation endonuclease (ribonuclease M5)